jgi:hypothetical protein
MGYAGQWIELTKKKTLNKSKTMVNPTLGQATFKRNLPGLQEGGLYLNK